MPHYFYNSLLKSESLKNLPTAVLSKRENMLPAVLSDGQQPPIKGSTTLLFEQQKIPGKQQVKWEFYFTVVFVSSNPDSTNLCIE